LSIFVGSGSFTNKKYSGVGIAFAGYGISPQRTQLTFVALTNFISDLLKLPGCLSDSGIILLLMWFGRPSFASGCKASGEKFVHLKMLSDGFIYIRFFSHHSQL
jgi:hypothetical protein